MENPSVFEDPTTWAATLLKLQDTIKLPNTLTCRALNQSFLQEKHDSSNGSQNSLYPTPKPYKADLPRSEPSRSKTTSSLFQFCSTPPYQPRCSTATETFSSETSSSLFLASSSQTSTLASSSSGPSMFDIPLNGIPTLKLSGIQTLY